MPLSVSRRRKEGGIREEEGSSPARLWRNFGRVPANIPTRRETKSSNLFGHSYRIEISFRHANFEMSLTENYGIASKSHGYFRNMFYKGGIKIQIEHFMTLFSSFVDVCSMLQK